MTIYELTDEMRELLSLMEDPDIDPEVFADTLDAVKGEFEAKADGYGCVRQELLNKISFLKSEENRLAEYRKKIEKNVESLEKSLKTAMELTGQKKIQTNLFTFAIRNNPAHVQIKDESEVPFDFIKTTTSIDKAAIKDFLKDHTVEWACMVQDSTSLSIK